MKAQAAGDNWRLDGTTITVTIPMNWKRRGGRKVIIAPDGGDAWAPAKPRPDETLIRALARAHRWKRMLEDGTYRSAAEIAEAEGITASFVNRLLRLTLLASDIQEAILDGRQPKGMQLDELTGAMPSNEGAEAALRNWPFRDSTGHPLFSPFRTPPTTKRLPRTEPWRRQRAGPARTCRSPLR